MGAVIEVETLSHPMMSESSMRWEKGPSAGRGGGGAEESGQRGGRAHDGRGASWEVLGNRTQQITAAARVQPRFQSDLHGGIRPWFASVMCDSLGSTEQFCCGTREAGRCRCRLGGRRPVAVRKNSDGGAREGGSRPAATAQGKGAAGGEDEEELSSLDLEYVAAGTPAVCAACSRSRQRRGEGWSRRAGVGAGLRASRN